MTPSNLTNVSMSEDDLTRIKSLVLTHMRSTLVQSLDPRLFLTVFRQEYVLNARECDFIKSSCSRSVCEGVEVLLDTLVTKGPNGYDVLCKALLEDRTQLHLLNGLGDTLTLFKHNFLCYRESQMKLAEQQWREMELKKQRAQIKQPPLHLAAPCLVTHNDYRALHQARSPMDIAPLVVDPGYYYTNNYATQEHEHYIPPQAQHEEYHQPLQFQQLQQQHYPTPAMSTQHHLQYSHSCFMYPPGGVEPIRDLPCGQQGN